MPPGCSGSGKRLVFEAAAALTWWGEAPERPKSVRDETDILPNNDAVRPNRVPSRGLALGHGSARLTI